jgi:hypothetical protein
VTKRICVSFTVHGYFETDTSHPGTPEEMGETFRKLFGDHVKKLLDTDRQNPTVTTTASVKIIV